MSEVKKFAWLPTKVYNYESSQNAIVWLNSYYTNTNIYGFKRLNYINLSNKYVIHPNILCYNLGDTHGENN
jgi:hypothetical protein